MTITIVWLPLHNAVKIANLILLKYPTWWQNQEQSYTNREIFSLTICQSAVQCCIVCYRNWLDLWCNSGVVDWFYSSEMSIASFSCKVGVYLINWISNMKALILKNISIILLWKYLSSILSRNKLALFVCLTSFLSRQLQYTLESDKILSKWVNDSVVNHSHLHNHNQFFVTSSLLMSSLWCY